jgi:polyvinyl alcohol dehydrogenase (cytochrome)
MSIDRVGFLAALAVGVSAAALGCKSSSPSAVAEASVPAAPLDCSADGGDWPMYGQNVCNTRATASAGALSATTAPNLAVKWRVDMNSPDGGPDAQATGTSADISATPAVVAGQLYVPDWSGMISRIEAASGSVVWTRSIDDLLGLSTDAGADGPALDTADTGPSSLGPAGGSITVARGTPVVTGGLVIFGVTTPSYPGPPRGHQAAMVAVDQNTGALVWQTVLDPHPYAVIASSPALEAGRLYVGVSSNEEGASLSDPSYVTTFRGSVVALDPATGKIVWQTPMIDDDVYYKAGGALAGYSGVAVWSGTPTIDRQRRQLYVTTGNNYSVPPSVADGGDLPAGDRVESIVALDLATGKVRWSERMTRGDVWTFAMFGNKDYDFGCGANLFQATIAGVPHDMVGAGQKSGVYWAVDADTGSVMWHTQVGPGGHLGGIHWGTAVDGARIYVGVNDEPGTPYTLGGKGDQAGKKTSVGSWAALDPATGETLWQVANPTMTAPVNGASVNGPLAVVNGVVFAGSMDTDGTMLGLDAKTGKVLWQYKSGATVYGGPAIVDGVVYWGNGYPQRLLFGTPGHTLFAFAVP